MKLPDLSHLQFLVMSVLLDGDMSGRQIRRVIADQGVKKSGPAFYQLMGRLEDSGYIKGWYEQKVIDGQAIKERRYRLLAPGLRALERTSDFYDQRRRSAVLKGGYTNA